MSRRAPNTVEDLLDNLRYDLAVLSALFVAQSSDSPDLTDEACAGVERMLVGLSGDVERLFKLPASILNRSPEDVVEEFGGAQ